MCSLSSGSTARRIDQVGWPQRCGADVVRRGHQDWIQLPEGEREFAGRYRGADGARLP